MDKRQIPKNYWYVAENIKQAITVKEYAKLVFQDVSYVRKLLRAGKIKGLKSGGRWYVYPVQKKRIRHSNRRS